MANFISTTNMGLTVPITGVAPGPDWANEVNASFVTVDAHDHSSGKGVQITPNGLNINADLSLASNNLVLVRTVRFQAPNVQPALSTDLTCLYAFGADLYYRDGSGNQVRITQSGSVTGATGNITNLTPPASVTYVGGSTSFVFQSDASISADLDGGSVILRNLTASSKGLTLSPPAAMAADYTITLPAKPAASALLAMSNTGVISTTAPDGTTIVNTGSVLKVGDGGITQTQIAGGFGLVPTGGVIPFGGTVVPTGYLLCDGTSYLRATYASLFTAIGTAYGAADGTHFNVPDMQGFFMRGVSGGSGRDPDAAGRTALNTGGNTGNNVGSIQQDEFQSHTHDSTVHSNAAINAGGDGKVSGADDTGAAGGNETRPLNMYFNFVIKT